MALAVSLQVLLQHSSFRINVEQVTICNKPHNNSHISFNVERPIPSFPAGYFSPCSIELVVEREIKLGGEATARSHFSGYPAQSVRIKILNRSIRTITICFQLKPH